MRTILLTTAFGLLAGIASAHPDPAAHVHAGEAVISGWHIGAGLGAALAVVWLAKHLRARAGAKTRRRK